MALPSFGDNDFFDDDKKQLQNDKVNSDNDFASLAMLEVEDELSIPINETVTSTDDSLLLSNIELEQNDNTAPDMFQSHDSNIVGLELNNETVDNNNIDANTINVDNISLESVGGIKKDSIKAPDRYIDKNSKKLFAYGKRPKDVPKQDGRVNVEKKVKNVRNVVIATCVVLVAFGVKGTFFPSGQLSVQDVENVVASQVGYKDFPKDRAQTFAKQFLIDYLTIKPNSDDSKVLQKYGEAIATRNPDPNYEQRVVSSPSLVDYRGFSNNSGAFVFNVSITNGEKTEDDKEKVTHLSYSVNVYYDSVTDGLNVAPGSPTIVPTIKLQDSRKIPVAKNLSVDAKSPSDKALVNKVSTTVKQFIKEYLKADGNNTSSLEQYLVSNPNPSLLDGLGGSMVLDGEEAVDIEAFQVDDVVKVQATVRMKPKGVDGSKGYVNTSKYAISLREQSGKFLIEKVTPLGYLPIDE